MDAARSAGGAGEPLTAHQKKVAALGFDIGGTKISAAMYDGQALVSDVKKVPTPSGSEAIIAAFLKIIADFQDKYTVTGIGIATAGIVDTVAGYPVTGTNNIPGWAGTQVKRIIESKTMIPVYVENDANAAAYGEAKSHNLANSPCTILITLGTGIGGGILLDGKVYHGYEYGAGSVGHFRIGSENKRRCTCGMFDCWEAYGSGIGLTATAKEVLAKVTPEQSPLVTNPGDYSAATLVAAARGGDPAAKQIIDRWHGHVCAGLAVLVHVFDPEAFILSGGLSEFVDLGLLSELLKDNIYPGMAQKLSIRKSALGPNAGLIGAAHLILDALTISNAPK
jgi:glucokinase